MKNYRKDFKPIFGSKIAETEKNLEEILEVIEDEEIFNPDRRFPTNSNPISTATRVLLSEEYYEDFKGVYELTYALHGIIYAIYSRDTKKDISGYTDDDISFNKFFSDNRPVKELFWQSSFWQYDSQYEVLRKESIKKLERKGRYYEKELMDEKTPLTDKPYHKAEKIHPTHDFNDKSEDNRERYNWIFGKYDFTDNYFIRFYWNLYPDKEIIAKFLKALQVCFDNSRIPFQFKFLSRISDYKAHADTGVLYLPRKHILICMELVRDIYNEFRNDKLFAPNNPMFTFKLADGLSFGENPDDRRYTSFGSYRSIHIAMAIVIAFKKTNKLPDVKGLIKILNTKNKNWTKQFYANEFSLSNYFEEFRFFETTVRAEYKFREVEIRLPKDSSVSSDWLNENHERRKKKYLSASVQIANILCKEAIWYNTKADDSQSYPLNCNWISFKNAIKDKSSETISYQFNTLNETFIEGRLGVAFFLRQIHRAYGDETFYRTSYRALEGALTQLPENPSDAYISELEWVIDQIVKMEDSTINRLPGFIAAIDFLKKKKTSKAIFNVNIQRQADVWGGFKDLIESVVSTQKNSLTEAEALNVDKLLADYFDVERPFGNALGTDEFCATIKDGYALLGYFFLRLYDPKTFDPLPYTFTNI